MTKLREAVVTDSVLSFLTTPSGASVAVITLTPEDASRPAVLGPEGLNRLDSTLDELSSEIGPRNVSAVIVAGSGKAFCAGADLDMMSSIRDREQSLALAQQGHRVLSRLSSLGVPTIAEINGVALGGGLELALHCTYRLAASSVRAIGLPEVSLGLIPGWGGATLLPRLVDFATAQLVLLDNPVKGNTLVTATKAHELGLVDAVADDVHLRDDVVRFIDDGMPVVRQSHTVSEDDISGLHASAGKYAQRAANPASAMSRLIDIIEHSSTIEAGFAVEDDALADLILTPEFRNRVYSFHLTSQRARKPAGVPDAQPREIKRIGVIGAGLMASQFATLFAERLRVPVVLTDVSQERLDSAITRISDTLSGRVDRGSLSPAAKTEILDLLSTTLDRADFASCDFVMEAVFEDMAVKVDVLRAIEEHVSTDCILATNTSSLSVTEMASALADPSRLIGFHFFNPVAVMPLIEVVSTERSDPAAVATAIACASNLKKTPVITKDLPGFVVNRLLSVYLSEAFDAVDGGTSPAIVSHALYPLRLPMDPFALVDLIGRSVTLHMIESLNAFCPERVHVSPILRRLTDEPVTASIADDILSTTTASGNADEQSIHDRTVDALTREIDLMLSEGVVSDVRDIDLCLLVGAGWPVAHGGVSRYLDECGSAERVLGRRFDA